MAKPSDYVQLTHGRITEANYYKEGNSSKPSEQTNVHYVVIGGARLLTNGNMPDHQSGDEVVVAYNRKSMKVLASWNKTKQKGTTTTVLSLIFHTNALVWIVLMGIVVYFLKTEVAGNPASPYFQYLKPIWGGLVGITLLVYFFSYRSWMASMKAQQMVNQHRK